VLIPAYRVRRPIMDSYPNYAHHHHPESAYGQNPNSYPANGVFQHGPAGSNYVKYDTYDNQLSRKCPSTGEWSYPRLPSHPHRELRSTNSTPGPDLTLTQSRSPLGYSPYNYTSEVSLTPPPPQYVPQNHLLRHYGNNLNSCVVDGGSNGGSVTGFSNPLAKGQGRLTPVVKELHEKFTAENPECGGGAGRGGGGEVLTGDNGRQRHLAEPSEPVVRARNDNEACGGGQPIRSSGATTRPSSPGFWLHGRIPYLILLLVLLLIVFLSLSAILIYYKCKPAHA